MRVLPLAGGAYLRVCANTSGAIQNPTMHDRAGGLPTNPLVLVGPVERLALQLSLHFEQSDLMAGIVKVHAA